MISKILTIIDIIVRLFNALLDVKAKLSSAKREKQVEIIESKESSKEDKLDALSELER